MEGRKLTYEDRKKLYIDAVTWNKPKRVLMDMGGMTGWFQADAGYSLVEAARDYEINKKCIEHFLATYNVDNFGNAFRFRFRLTDPLRKGTSNLGVTDETINSGNVNAILENLMSVSDLDAYKENSQKVLWETVFFNAFPNAKNMTPQELAEAAKELVQFREEAAKSREEMREKYGLLFPYPDVVAVTPFVHELFYKYLGIKGLSVALRRTPQKIHDICDYFDEKQVAAALARLDSLPDGPTAGIKSHYDAGMGTSESAVLNRKQIERLLLKTWKPVMDKLQEKQKITHFGIEGSFINSVLGEFLSEYDYVSVPVEMDDPYEIRKKFPKLTIRGGLSVDVMGHSTPEKCVDMAKRAIDELGRDGGLIMGTNKFVTYDYDMNAENLKAVCDFVTSYEIN